MLSPETTWLVKQVQHKDRLHQLQKQQLLQEVGLNKSRWETHKKVAGWLGTKMVAWGARLESYSAATHSKALTLKS